MSPGFFIFAMTKSLREVLRHLKVRVAARVVRRAVAVVRRLVAVATAMAPDRQAGVGAEEKRKPQ